MGDYPPVIRPGMVFWIDYGPGNPTNKKVHVRAIVDERLVVYRHWSYRRRDWQYQIDSLYYFWHLDQNGHLRMKPGRPA